MPFELTPEQETVRQIAREFAQREIVPHRKELAEGNEEYQRELMKKQAALGFHLNRIPREEGGTGLGLVARCVQTEEIFAAWPTTYPFHWTEMAYYFAKATGGEVEKKWMPGIIKGEVLAAPMVTEASGGSDILGISTTARKEGDGWVINGRKCFTGGGQLADFAMVLAKTGDPNDPATKGTRALSAFIVEKGTPGFEVTRLENTLVKKAHMSESVLRNVKVPASHLVGEVGQGLRPVFKAVGEVGRMHIMASLTGCILGAYECSVKYANERILYGRPIATLQAIQSRIADMFTDLEICRALTYRAAWLVDRGARCAEEQAVGKYFATQASIRCGVHAMSIHGAYGILDEYMPQVYYRYAAGQISTGGTDESLKLIISGAALRGANPDLGSKPASETIIREIASTQK